MFDAAKLRFRQRLAGFDLHQVDQIYAAPHLIQTYPVEDAFDMQSEHRLVKINRAADVGHLEHHMVDAVEAGWNRAHRILAGVFRWLSRNDKRQVCPLKYKLSKMQFRIPDAEIAFFCDGGAGSGNLTQSATDSNCWGGRAGH